MAEKSLEQKVQLALDLWEIQNVASKHEYYHKGLKHREELRDIWAQKQPDVSWQNNKDRYVGMEALVNFYADHLENSLKVNLERMHEKDSSIEVKPENLGMGYLWVHLLTTPVIEVAGDGKTAKGVWMSLGDITGPRGGEGIGATWAQDMYAMDFIKEDGKWKIWHLSTYVDFYAPFGTSWVDNPYNFFGDRPLAEPGVADKFPVSNYPGNYYNAYSPKTVAQFLPRIPEPYETFSKTFSY